MINLVCGDAITKIWIANLLFKYDYKMKKIENMVISVGTLGIRGLTKSLLDCLRESHRSKEGTRKSSNERSRKSSKKAQRDLRESSK